MANEILTEAKRAKKDELYIKDGLLKKNIKGF